MVKAENLPRAKPEEVGFSSEHLARISGFFSQQIKNKELAGVVTLVSRYGKVVHLEAQGRADIETGNRVSTDSIFRLASQTKPITATALMMLYEDGKLQLSDPIDKYLPELKALSVFSGVTADGNLRTEEVQRAPTVQDLLRHTAGFTAWWNSDAVAELYRNLRVIDYNSPSSDVITKLSKLPLLYQPGTKWRYSHANTIQGRLVEVISGQPLDEFMRERLFEPLGTKDTGFWVPPEKHHRVPHVYNRDAKGELYKYIGPDNFDSFFNRLVTSDRYLRKLTLPDGDGALASTAEDYWRYAQMMLNGGELNGGRFLSPETVKLMARNHIEGIEDNDPVLKKGYGYGLGFGVLTDAAAAGVIGPENTIEWGGGYGTRFWIDFHNNIVALVMIQRRDRDYTPEMRALVYGALVE